MYSDKKPIFFFLFLFPFYFIMDLSLEHCGSEHLKVERMCIISMVFWDKFSGNDSFLKKQVITVGNSKYSRTLRKRGSWKQKLVIACNQFASAYLLWFSHIKWLLSLRGEGSLLLNLKRFSPCWKKGEAAVWQDETWLRSSVLFSCM